MIPYAGNPATAEQADKILVPYARFVELWNQAHPDDRSLALTQATFDGKPAQLQAGPKGMVLMLPGETTGRLELHAVAKPEYLGPRGSAGFTLPPLPAAVMTVALPDADLELEAADIETIPERRMVNGAVEYSFGLGMVRESCFTGARPKLRSL